MANVLILDDERDLTELYRMALEAGRHRVLGIYDSPIPMLLDRTSWPAPDVIIVDERLNGLSGTDFLPLLHETFPGTRILFASADPDAVEDALLRCADGAKKKPFPMEDLVREVERLLQAPPSRPCSEKAKSARPNSG